jgi:hypothetical protein
LVCPAYYFRSVKIFFYFLKHTIMQQNLISATLSNTVVAEVETHVKAIATLLAGVLQNLEAKDRQAMAKMGDKTLAFVQKALQYAGQDAAMLPSYISLPEAAADLALTRQLDGILKLMAPLCQSVQDTVMMAGSDCYIAGLGIYGHIKAAAANNVQGATAIAQDLSGRFPGKSRKKQME